MSQTPHPNLAQHLKILSQMTPEQRLKKTFELSELSKQAFLTRLRRRFPEKSEDQIRELYLVRQMRRDGRKRAIAFKHRAGSIDAN
jgi:hypothetical protein